MIEIDSNWKKHAAQVYADKDVEKAFLDQAYMFIQNKATPLMKDPYRLGFEIVYKNDANSKMVGIFAFKVGGELIYAPAFFVNGAIKGTDLLYRHKNKTFVPLTNEWSTYLVGLQESKSGEAIAAGTDGNTNSLELQKLISPQHLTQNKMASYSEYKEHNDWLPDMAEVYSEIEKSSYDISAKEELSDAIGNETTKQESEKVKKKQSEVLESIGDKTEVTEGSIATTKEASSIKDMILDVGPHAVKQLTDLMQKDATFAQNILTHIGLDNVLLEEVKEAKGRCWNGYEPVPGKEPYSNDSCRPAGSKKKKKKKTEKSANVEQVQGLMAQGMGMKDAIKTAYPNYTEEECNALASKLTKSANVEQVQGLMAQGMGMKDAIKTAYPNYTEEECNALAAKLTKSASGGLTLHMGFLNSNVKEASEKLAANGFLFEDNRSETNLVHRVFEEGEVEYSGVSEAGIHKLLMKDGSNKRCLVAPSNGKSLASSYWYDDDDMGTSQLGGGSRGFGSSETRYTVVDLDTNATSTVASKKIITADTESERSVEDSDLDSFPETPSVGSYYVLLDISKGMNASTVTDCFYVKSKVSSGSGVDKYKIDWSDSSFDSDDNLPTLTLNPDYEGNNYKDKVFKKGDVAFVKVNKKQDVDLASSSDLHNLIMGGGMKSAAVHYTGRDSYISKSGSTTTSEQSELSAKCYLMKYGSFSEKLATDILDKSKTKGRVSFFMPKTAYNMSFGEDPESYFTEDVDDIFNIAQQSPQSVSLMSDSDEPNMPESRLGDSIKFDDASQLEGKGPNDLAALAEQLGTPSLFEHGVVGSLANTYDSNMLIDKYFPDLEKALDRLGRMVFLFYWKPEDFSHLYGSDDQSSLENMLVSNFKSFGELVLELLKKISSFSESTGRTY